MKFNFKFSNLLGTVYRGGNLLFSADGNSVISPVGNRLTIYNLEKNKSQTLPFESRSNITAVALSPSGSIIIAVAEDGEGILCSMLSKTVMHRYRFNGHVRCVTFSPNDKYFAATRSNSVLLFKAPGPHTCDYNPFVLLHTYMGSHDETTCVDWSTDSKFFVVGSKDMCTRVYSSDTVKFVFTLGGHNDCIVGTYFEENSLDLYTVSRNGHVRFWECNHDSETLASKLSERTAVRRGSGKLTSDATPEQDESENNEGESLKSQLSYGKVGHFSPIDLANKETPASRCYLTSCHYHRRIHMLVTSFSNGTFFLHEMPSYTLVHSLCISDHSISAVQFNCSGDWLALGCQQFGQLVVWEWQSETYIMKQQDHYNNMSCLQYSPDGQFIATGGEDGKMKVWNVDTGFCVVTFTEHTSAVSAISYLQSGKAIISASKDGTVRAFDLKRYRNFRTFTSPRPTQFTSLAVDPSGEVVAAGGWDEFEIFMWSVATGHLIDVVSGHEGPVSCISFCPQGALLASGSVDKSVRLWGVFSSKGRREVINIGSDVLALEFRPDGAELAVASLNGQITFFDVQTTEEVSSIEGRKDLGSCRRSTDLITAKKMLKGKAFSTLCYSADGNCILAAGRSKYICIYFIREQILLKKFPITKNTSLDGVDEFVNRRKMTEFGNMTLIEDREETHDSRVSISLPGVRKGDMSSRSYKPEIRVASVKFSPTGRCWAAVTTEGMLLYSLDQRIVFEPMELETTATTDNVISALSKGEFLSALSMAIKLGENQLIAEVVEKVEINQVQLLISSLPEHYVDRILNFLFCELESTRHVEFYLSWIHTIFVHSGTQLKTRAAKLLPLLHSLQKNLQLKYTNLARICDHNKFYLQYLENFGSEGDNRPNAEEQSSQLEEDMSL